MLSKTDANPRHLLQTMAFYFVYRRVHIQHEHFKPLRRQYYEFDMFLTKLKRVRSFLFYFYFIFIFAIVFLLCENKKKAKRKRKETENLSGTKFRFQIVFGIMC